MQAMAPKTFVANVRRHSASGSRSAGATAATPALFTRTSMPPGRARDPRDRGLHLGGRCRHIQGRDLDALGGTRRPGSIQESVSPVGMAHRGHHLMAPRANSTEAESPGPDDEPVTRTRRAAVTLTGPLPDEHRSHVRSGGFAQDPRASRRLTPVHASRCAKTLGGRLRAWGVDPLAHRPKPARTPRLVSLVSLVK